MKLNDLETKFFDKILNAELAVPVHATLESKKETFDIIVVPEVTAEGYFQLKYYNAQAHNSRSGPPAKGLSVSEMLGTHPSLELAWLESEPVSLTIESEPLPFNPKALRKVDATVLYAGRSHRGVLGLDNNQVTVHKAPLNQAEFSIVSFTDFVAPQQHITLEGHDKWRIVLTKDVNPTRDLTSHTGLINKIDGNDFAHGELTDVLEGLKNFFAFAAGVYCHHTVAIGYDSGNRPVWGQVGGFAPDRPHSNWFSSAIPPGAHLERLFPGFWRRWRDKRNEITAVIRVLHI